ncbi:hypothetical protein CONPUDRAFT_37063, partial [Coniophora puteana RWD-64-598 SS2]
KIIWLSGESGSAKSPVAYTLAEGFHSNGTLAASFFFSRRHPVRSTTERVIPTISYQLGLRHWRAKEAISDVIAEDPSLLRPERSRYEQFTRLILEPLKRLKNVWKDAKSSMVMFLEALDECEPGESNER